MADKVRFEFLEEKFDDIWEEKKKKSKKRQNTEESDIKTIPQDGEAFAIRDELTEVLLEYVLNRISRFCDSKRILFDYIVPGWKTSREIW